MPKLARNPLSFAIAQDLYFLRFAAAVVRREIPWWLP